MSLPHEMVASAPAKMVSFAILEAGWITWLLVGFSTGGISGVVERAVTLLRGSDWLHRLDARLRRSSPPGSPPNLALPSHC